MIIDKKDIYGAKSLDIEEKIHLNPQDYRDFPDIVSTDDIDASLHAELVAGIIYCHLEIKYHGMLRSTRTSRPVSCYLDNEDDFAITFEKNDDLANNEDIIFVDQDEYDLYGDVLSLVITSIPLQVVGDDEPSSIYGDNWEVITEDEYNKKRKEDIDPRFASLKDFDVDD
jgi:uncharacterized protein